MPMPGQNQSLRALLTALVQQQRGAAGQQPMPGNPAQQHLAGDFAISEARHDGYPMAQPGRQQARARAPGRALSPAQSQAMARLLMSQGRGGGMLQGTGIPGRF